MVRLMATSSLNTPKTPDSKNYAGVIVGDLTSNLVDDIPFDIGGGVTAITARIPAEAGKVVRMQVADSASSGADANYVHAEVTLANVGWNELPSTLHRQLRGIAIRWEANILQN